MGITLQHDDHPSEEDIQVIEDNLSAFNAAQVGKADSKKHAVYLKEGGEIKGGVVFVCMPQWAYVKLLWVHEDHRGGGYGGRLLNMAEETAKESGCKAVMLDTFSFQAPAFYMKQGYTEVARIDGYPVDGASRFYYQKQLR